MEIALKGILAGFWLILVPSCAGTLFLQKKNAFTFSESFMAGYVFIFSVMEILSLPMIYLKLPLHVLVAVYGILTFLAAVWGITVILKKQKESKKRKISGGFGHRWKKIKNISPWFWFAAVLIVLQIGTVSITAHFDADDAMYVGAASTAVQTDTIYSVNPYTGYDYKALPSRYVLSPFPVFLAVISRLCMGLHPAIVAHVVFPAVFLFMAYLVQNLLGKKWFPNDKEAQGMFLFFIAVLNWFSAYSVYNAGNFQMIRIWQGKALLASAMLPFVFYLCLSVMIPERREYSWLLLGMANCGCCLITSMGIMLAPLMIGLFVLVSIIYRRRPSYIYKAALCCIPSLILGIVYIWMN